MTNIYSHAVAKYAERVLNISSDQAGASVKEYAREQILETIENPEMVYRNTDVREEPVYIRNGCAVPYREDEGEVPTAYDSGVFLSKMDSKGSVKDVRGQA